MDVASVVLELTIGSICSPICRRAGYVFQLKRNLEELRLRLDYLNALQSEVMLMLEQDERQLRKTVPLVERWAERVNSLSGEASYLLESCVREIHRRCWWNLCFRYRYGKKVVRLLEEVVNLMADSYNFREIRMASSPPQPEVEQQVPTGPTTGLDLMLSRVWSSISKEQVGIIGICGKEGVERTALLKQINKKFDSDFGAVIWVTVSDTRLAKVQEDIAKKIGISDEKWKNKSVDERTTDIFTVLRKKKFLLLLDDMWEPVDLANFGVPLPNRENGSKVVFTTSSEDICREMEAQVVINMGTWQDDFPENSRSRNFDGSTTLKLKTAARESFKKTRQHAVRILTRSSTRLSEKEIVEEADHEAQPSTSSLQEMQNLVHANDNEPFLDDLKHRYDSLPSNTVRICFLYCTLFPPDFRILKDDLIHYWICEKFEDSGPVETYNEGYYIIDILVRAQLLDNEGKYVRIRSKIRDIGLRMADNLLVLTGAQLVEAPGDGKWKGIRRISLMENSIQSLSQVPAFADLFTLFLSRNPCLVMITGDFFQSMKALTVLDLSMSSIQELPPEISNLVSLQYLNLSHTSVSLLPVELKMLKRLKYLNLEHTVFLNLIPREVISQLSMLQFLKMFRCGSVNEEVEDNVLSDGNLHIEEIQCLEHLKVLSITIRQESAFQLIFNTDRLRTCTQALYFEHLIGSTSLNISWLNKNHQQINHNDELEGSNVEPPSNLLYSVISSNNCFNSLQEVRVEKCFDLQDLTWLVLAPSLKILSVTTCGKMEEIISRAKLEEIPIPDVCKNLKVFVNLEVLELHNLPQIKSIYWEALAFPFLEKIEVYNCPMLSKLPLNSESARGGKVVIKGEEHWWNDVEWMDDSAKIAFLQCFRSF